MHFQRVIAIIMRIVVTLIKRSMNIPVVLAVEFVITANTIRRDNIVKNVFHSFIGIQMNPSPVHMLVCVNIPYLFLSFTEDVRLIKFFFIKNFQPAIVIHVVQSMKESVIQSQTTKVLLVLVTVRKMLVVVVAILV